MTDLTVCEDIYADLIRNGMHEDDTGRVLDHYVAVFPHVDVGRRLFINAFEREIERERSAGLRSGADAEAETACRVFFYTKILKNIVAPEAAMKRKCIVCTGQKGLAGSRFIDCTDDFPAAALPGVIEDIIQRRFVSRGKLPLSFRKSFEGYDRSDSLLIVLKVDGKAVRHALGNVHQLCFLAVQQDVPVIAEKINKPAAGKQCRQDKRRYSDGEGCISFAVRFFVHFPSVYISGKTGYTLRVGA